MVKGKICFKIIAFVLIQAFLALDLCWAGDALTTSSASESTLAPAVALDKVDLHLIFNELLKIDQDDINADIVRIGEEEMAEDAKMAASTPGEGNSGQNLTSGSSFDEGNIPGADDINTLPPPTPSAFYIWARNVLPYPFNKKRLEKDLRAMGFGFEGEGIERKQLALLIETLGRNNLIQKLKQSGITTIKYVPAFIESGTITNLGVAIPEKESERCFITITDIFLNQKLQTRVSLINDAINELNHNVQKLQYIDFNGEAKMASSKELGLPPETADILRKIRKIAKNYSDPPYWNGIAQFCIGDVSDRTEFMRVPFSDRDDVLSISVHVLPDLIKLDETSPDLFRELIEVGISHEGGVHGHLMKWPLTTPYEMLTYFNWRELTLSVAEKMVKLFVNRGWEEIKKRGVPPADQWNTALSIIKQTLAYFNYDRNNPEPYGIVWKEYQANYGMVKEKGIRGVALWFWFQKYFRGISVHDFGREFAHHFAFLDETEREQVLSEVDTIIKEYSNASRKKAGVLGELLNRFGKFSFLITMLLMSLPLAGCTFERIPGSSSYMSSLIVGMLVVLGVVAWIVRKVGMGKSVEKKTKQLVRKVVDKQDTSELREFYRQSDLKDKQVIIHTLAKEAGNTGEKYVNPELFEGIFMDALYESVQAVPQEDKGVDQRQATAADVWSGDTATTEVTSIIDSKGDKTVKEKEIISAHLEIASDKKLLRLRYAAVQALKIFPRTRTGTAQLISQLQTFLQRKKFFIDQEMLDELVRIVLRLKGLGVSDDTEENMEKLLIDSKQLPAAKTDIEQPEEIESEISDELIKNRTTTFVDERVISRKTGINENGLLELIESAI